MHRCLLACPRHEVGRTFSEVRPHVAEAVVAVHGQARTFVPVRLVNDEHGAKPARVAQITALAQHNAARLNLAAALGRAETFKW